MTGATPPTEVRAGAAPPAELSGAAAPVELRSGATPPVELRAGAAAPAELRASAAPAELRRAAAASVGLRSGAVPPVEQHAGAASPEALPAHAAPLVELRAVSRLFDSRRSLADMLARRPAAQVRAVDGVDLCVSRGECLGLIGESGCGKSTLGRLALRLREPTSGTVCFDGVDLAGLDARALAALRPRMQIVFQDPYASLNPRRNVEQIVGLPLQLHTRLTASERRTRIVAALEWVGLDTTHLRRYPHQFSGGQRQRIGIARALVLHPDFVVCDEPVSALDVSVQAQIVELLGRLRRELGLAYLFISHDLAVVAHVSDRIAVMYLGRIVELGPTRAVVTTPRHPYTRALLSAVPQVHAARGARIRLTGEPPSPLAPPDGCPFHPRCVYAQDVCRHTRPELTETASGHAAACHFADTIADTSPAPEAVACNP